MANNVWYDQHTPIRHCVLAAKNVNQTFWLVLLLTTTLMVSRFRIRPTKSVITKTLLSSVNFTVRRLCIARNYAVTTMYFSGFGTWGCQPTLGGPFPFLLSASLSPPPSPLSLLPPEAAGGVVRKLGVLTPLRCVCGKLPARQDVCPSVCLVFCLNGYISSVSLPSGRPTILVFYTPNRMAIFRRGPP